MQQPTRCLEGERGDRLLYVHLVDSAVKKENKSLRH